MSIWFSHGGRFQRGRGIGGLLRLAKGLFKPAIQTIGKAAKSNTGKAIGRALKNQAIESAINLATDVLSGNSLKEGVESEVNNIKDRVVKSNKGKAVGRALKNQAIESVTNLATDVLSGNSLKEGVEREMNNIKGRAALGLQHLGEDKEDKYRVKKKKNKKVQNSNGKKKTKVMKKPVGKWVLFEDDS